MAQITNPNEGIYTENKVQLKETTAFFKPGKMKEAYEHASRKRSYVGIAVDYSLKFKGFYVPA